MFGKHIPRLGYVGVGFMGKGMVKNVMKKANTEYNLKSFTIFDTVSTNTESLQAFYTASQFKFPFSVVSSSSAVAQMSDTVCVSLPTEEITHNVLFGNDGLISGFNASTKRGPIVYDWDIPPNTPVVVDHGTFSQAFVKDCHVKAKEVALNHISH
jgi:3-hydroxyisobutyrate dehydrogenase-like beta-hydroxyacid dehydrogenase